MYAVEEWINFRQRHVIPQLPPVVGQFGRAVVGAPTHAAGRLHGPATSADGARRLHGTARQSVRVGDGDGLDTDAAAAAAVGRAAVAAADARVAGRRPGRLPYATSSPEQQPAQVVHGGSGTAASAAGAVVDVGRRRVVVAEPPANRSRRPTGRRVGRRPRHRVARRATRRGRRRHRQTAARRSRRAVASPTDERHRQYLFVVRHVRH